MIHMPELHAMINGIKLLSLCLSIALVLPDTASAVTLTGKVLDELGQPMPNVNVQIPSRNIGIHTNKNGVFQFENFPDGTYEVRFTFIGYRQMIRMVTVSAGMASLEIRMEVQPLEANVLTVAGEKELPSATQSVVVLGAQELDENRGQTLGETLESVPGVTTLSTGPAVAKPVLRGLHSQRVLILNADVAHEGQQWGSDHAPEIDPFAPARIEVLKGAASVQYGAGAIGGVIRILPLELRRDSGSSGNLSINGFSNNRQGASSLMLEGGMKRIRGLGWRAQGSFRRAGAAKTPSHFLKNTGFDERNWSFALGLNRETAGIEAYYSHFGTELGIYADSHIGNTTNLLAAIERGLPTSVGSFTYDINSPKQVIRHDLFSLRSRYRFAGAGTLEINYAQQYNRRKEFDAHDPVKPGFDLGLLSQSGEIIFQHASTARLIGTAGFSLQRQENTRFSSGFLIPDFLAYTTGVFGYEQWTGDRWIFQGGVRYDYRWQDIGANARHNVAGGVQTYNNLSGALGATYQATSEFSISVNVGQAWRPPSVNELFSSGVHHGAAQIEQGDSNLKSETSINTDLTLLYQNDRIHAEFSGYNTLFNNFINLYPEKRLALTIRGAFPVFSYLQADARFTGFDGHLEYDVNEYLAVHGSASIVQGQNLDTNEPVFLITPPRFTLGGKVRFPEIGRITDHGLDLDVSLVRKQTRFPQGADFVEPPRGYQLVDLYYAVVFSAGTNPIRTQLGVHNLLNTKYRDYLNRYRYFIDDPGRNITLRISIPFGQAE